MSKLIFSKKYRSSYQYLDFVLITFLDFDRNSRPYVAVQTLNSKRRRVNYFYQKIQNQKIQNHNELENVQNTVKVVKSDNFKRDLNMLKLENEELRLKIKDCLLEFENYENLRQELCALSQKVSKVIEIFILI